MKALIQRVRSASVEVEGELVSSIGAGMLVLLGVIEGDTTKDMDYILKKTSMLRIFEDSDQKMNLSILDTGGEALVVSQFTLAADTKKGNRPSFQSAMEPVKANEMYEEFMQKLNALDIKVEGGRFSEMMDVSLINDGPVTIMLDSRGDF